MSKQKGEQPRMSQPQLVVRIPDELDRNLREAANDLGLDISGLVRLILIEHIAEYIERGITAGERLRQAQKKRFVDSPLPSSETPPEHDKSLPTPTLDTLRTQRASNPLPEQGERFIDLGDDLPGAK